MKQFLVTASLLLSLIAPTYSQSYTALIARADSAYTAKSYALSWRTYETAFKTKKGSSVEYYNAGCSAALDGQKKKALAWLDLAIDLGWSNINHFKSDSDLTTLHEEKEWPALIAKLQKKIDEIEKNYDKPLQAKLLSIYETDQSIRKVFMDSAQKYGFKSPQLDPLRKKMMYQDSVNLIEVKKILDTQGWVGPKKVGGQANQTLFLVIQHSDLATQQKYLPMMREAVKAGNATASSLALLEDRVALGEGRKQIYGSQIGYDSSGKSFLSPLEDPDNVDKRRTEVGLGDISTYLKRFGITWNLEEYKKTQSK